MKIPPNSLTRTILTVPAAALMLGAAEAGSTVGLNFQDYYYNDGGAGYQTTGMPVTAKAFGVLPENWFNSDPLSCGWSEAPGTTPISTTIPFGGTLSALVNAPNAWQSAIGLTTTAWEPVVVTPGNDEVTWGYISSGYGNPGANGAAPTVKVSNLAAKFPNGYVIQSIAAHRGNATFNDVDFTDGVTTNTSAYSTYFVAGPVNDNFGYGSGTVGLSAPSGAFSANTIDIKPQLQTAGKYSVLAGFIITDQPVVSVPPKNTSILSGNTLNLSAGAFGLPPITYQWRKNGTPIPGQTNATLTKTGASTADNGSYDVVATNAFGTTTSDAATVTVVVPVAVTWDADPDTTGAQDGDGMWDSTASNWWNGSSDIAWNDFNQVTFGAGDTGSYTVTLSGALNPGSITVTGTDLDYTLSGTGSITGTGALTKTGTGVLTLSTANSYSGGTTVSQGTLKLNNSSAAGTGGITLGDSNSGSTTPTLNIGVPGDLTLGALTIGANVTNATVAVNPGGATGFLTFSNITLNSALTLWSVNNSGNGWEGFQTTGAKITGNGAGPGNDTLILTNSGSSQAYLQANTNANDFLGNVHIVSGEWRLQATNTNLIFPDTASVTVDSGAILKFNPGSLPESIDALNGSGTVRSYLSSTFTIGASGGSGVFSGVLANQEGVLAVTKIGTGTQILSGANTYTGNTTVNGGTLQLSAAGRLMFRLGNASGTSNTLSGAATATLDGGFSIDTTAADSLTAGTWNLETMGANSTYGSSFMVYQANGSTPWTDAGGNKWTKTGIGGRIWTFDEATGTLTLMIQTFSTWAAANAPGQTIAQDHDNDGVSNGIEYFMGLSGSAFTANPGVVGGKVSWPKGPSYTGVYGTNYTIQTSTNLSTWTDVLIGDPNLSNGNPVQYTLPTGNAKTFSRLKVTGP